MCVFERFCSGHLCGNNGSVSTTGTIDITMPRGPVILEPSWYEEVMNAGLVQRFVSMVLSFMKCPSCHNRLYADVVFDERISYS